MPDPARTAAIAVVALVVGLVATAGWLAGRRLVPAETSVPVVVAEADAVDLTVHAAGAVVRPGLVVVPPGARVADVIAAAGGAAPDADLGGVNLAEPVADAGRVVVPRLGDPDTASTDGGPIRLNQADAAALETLPGIGPVLAARIVEHREAVGSFETVEDLLDVSGIGERLLAGLADLVVP